jgi:hypothetical protein
MSAYQFFDEPTFIRDLANRDLPAVEFLYDRYAAKLYKIICCHAVNESAAQEALDHTFFEIIQNIEEYNTDRSTFLIWMAVKARSRGKLPLAPIAVYTIGPTMQQGNETDLTSA